MRLDRNPARAKAGTHGKQLEEFLGVVPKLRAEVERLTIALTKIASARSGSEARLTARAALSGTDP